MAVTADRVIVELEAKLDRYEANVRRAEARFDAATKSIAADAKRMEREVSRSADAVGQRFRALAATVGAAFSAQQVAQLADSYTRFTNQLKVAGVEGLALAKVQEQLFGIAQKNGVELETLGALYSRVSQSAGDLGASSADIIKLTEGVAAGLRVQGVSADTARGAILGLTQALGSTRVLAEEFNQINEGAPALLRAVAQNIDAAGGSISRLRALVVDGKVSNQEFFRAFLAGSADLQAQAEKANLTIANSFTVLNNALGQYIGQADQSLSATEQISAAIISLSENLDTVAAAIGVISAVLLGRFVAGMTAAAGSTGVASTALFALQARAVGAASTMEALALTGATAGRALLAAFGGPVGVAVTALTLGLGYLATSSNTAAAATQNVGQQADVAARFQDNLNRILASDPSAKNAADANSLATARRNAANAAYQQAAAEIALRKAQAEKTLSLASRGVRLESRGRGGTVEVPLDTFRGRGGSEQSRAIRAAELEKQQAERDQAALDAAKKAALAAPATVPAPRVRPPAAAPARTGGRAGGTGGGTGRTVDPAAAAARFADDVARGELALRQALADAVGTAAARREVERQGIRVEQESNARAIKADEDLTALQREKLLTLNDQIAAAKLAAVAAEAEREAIENGVLLREGDLRNQQDILRAQAQLADTAKERRAIELRLLDLQYEEERIRLQAIADNAALDAAEREAARRRLASLDEQQGLDRERVRRDTEGPLERRRRELNRSPEQLQEAAEQWVVDTLDSVQDRLRDAISKRIGVDDPILGGILDLFIEQVILRPLANAFAKAGSGEGGGVLGSIVSTVGQILPAILGGGRASGGHVVAGRMYRVNEGGGSGVEGFQPAGSGKIIPLGRMRSASRGGSVVFQPTFNIDASGVNPDGFADGIVRAVRKETAVMVREGMRVVNQGVPGRLAQYERDGT